jgi:hypothetical protein
MNELLLLLLEQCGNIKERLEGKCRGLKRFTRCPVNAKDFKALTWCTFCSLVFGQRATLKSSMLRRKSIELLKELIQILQEIIGSGDEESFRRLEQTIRNLDENRRRPSHTVH